MAIVQTDLVNIFIVKRHRSTKGGAQIRVEAVSCPKCSFTALELDIVDIAITVHSCLSMNTKSKNQVCSGSKQIPAMIEPRLRQEIKALSQPSLHAGKAYLAFLDGELVFCSREITSTDMLN